MQEKKLLSDAILISGIPVVAYAFAYFFEYGYLSKFGLPDFLISVSIERFFFALSSVIGIIIMWFSTINYLMIVLSDLSFQYTRLILSAIFFLIYPALALYQLLFLEISTFTIIMSSISLLGIFFVYILPWLETRNFKDWLTAVDEADDRDWERNQNGLTVKIAKKLGTTNYLTIIFCLLILPFTSMYLGKRSADKQRLFMATSIDQQEYALIRVYNDKGILVRSHRSWHSLYRYEYIFEPKYIILNPSQNNLFFLKRVSTKTQSI